MLKAVAGMPQDSSAHRLTSSNGEPRSRSRLTMPRCPPPAAQCSPVAPVPAALRKSAPCSSRKVATSSCPYIQAHRNPACNSRFAAGSFSVPSEWKKVLTMSSQPTPAALSRFRLAPREARNTEPSPVRWRGKQRLQCGRYLRDSAFLFGRHSPATIAATPLALRTNSGWTLVAARPRVVHPPPYTSASASTSAPDSSRNLAISTIFRGVFCR